MSNQNRPTTTSTNYDKKYDQDPVTPTAQTVKAGEYDASRKGRSPDDRSTEPEPSATNHDRPVAAGAGVESVPGSGLLDSDAEQPSAPVAHVGGHSSYPRVTSGVNRVEDQESAQSPRLSVPSDDAGPGPSAQTPELQDPNYSAATERAKK